MPLVIPKWLDESFVLKCLKGGENKEQIAVKNLQVTAAVPEGTNYLSDLFRVKIEYEQKNSKQGIHHLSLIVKSPLVSSNILTALEEHRNVEPNFYNRFVPLASKLLPNDRFAPETFYSSVPNVIVMLDLSSVGFSIGDRQKLLDFDHCRLYVNAAAAMHASSVAIHKEDPEYVESLGKEKLFSHNLNSIFVNKQVNMSGMYCMADKMEGMEEFKKYAKLVRDCTNTMWDRVVRLHERSKSLNVLHQGDPWITNMMFKYNTNGEVEDVRILDYQEMRYASPVNELVFFIWTSASHEVREDRLEDLYYVYCNTLNRKLEECNCPERLAYEDLKTILQESSILALLMAASYFTVFNSNKVMDVDAILPSDTSNGAEAHKRYYDEEHCTVHLPRLLKQLKNCGVFNYLEKGP